ncbi:MAG: HAD hydrolase-like protein [Propionibacteriaceae bacterium]|nr:HAD hydrolase-like protein [Propionibacteriaceae bacterium]
MKQSPSRFYQAYFFDLDGTVYLGDEPLPGAAQTIQALKDTGAIVRYLSNNPTRTPAEYADKLTRLGIPTADAHVITTIQTTVWWLKNNYPKAVVFPIAESPLIDALRQSGFRLSDDPSQIDVVIASYDRAFTYAKLQTAFDALWMHKRAILIQTNPDRYCPFPGGRGEPDAAAITAAIEASAGVTCAANMGKPSPSLLRAALDGTGIAVTDCLMTGDRLATDIQMAMDAGMDAAVVFTGETKPADVTEEYAGVFQLESLTDLLP